MTTSYRYTTLPKVWPGKQRAAGFRRERGPFKLTTWTKTESLLLRELRQLGARDIVIAVDMPHPQQWNARHTPRAGARAQTPAVIVSFMSAKNGEMIFPCDTYADWETNIYAIAKSLEHLRAVDRYGVTVDGQQYTGFQLRLPSAATTTMTTDQAAEIIAGFSELPAHVIVNEPSVARIAVQRAKNATHPDGGGAPDDFERVSKAADVLEAV